MKISLASIAALVALPAVAGRANSACCHIPEGKDCSMFEDDEDVTPMDYCITDTDDAMSVAIGQLGKRACANAQLSEDQMEAIGVNVEVEDEVDMTYCKLPKERQLCEKTCMIPNRNGVPKPRRFRKGVRFFTDFEGNPIEEQSEIDARCQAKLDLWVCREDGNPVQCDLECESPDADPAIVSGPVYGVGKLIEGVLDEAAFCDKLAPRALSHLCPKIERTYTCCDQNSDCLDGCGCWELRGDAPQHKSHKGFCWDTKPKYFTSDGSLGPHRSIMCNTPIVCGDPHFRTWSGKWYDYHGECDLVLAKDTSFEDGKGLDIHIRTKARLDMSYIESAAIKIGDELTFEVTAYGEYVLNGVEDANFEGAFPADATFTMNHTMINKKEHHYDILKNGKSAIHIKTHKDYVSVETKIRLPESQGLLGDYVYGEMLGRDGETVFPNPNEFGQEWQVGPEDPVIFQAKRFPQYPQKCILPEQKKLDHRMLEGGVSMEFAHEACAHWGSQKHMCAFDVVRSQDMDMAAIGPH